MLYVKQTSGDLLIISLYVDELLPIGNNVGFVDDLKNQMQKEFEMLNMGLMAYFLSKEVHHNQQGIFICQKKYAYEVLVKFGMKNSKPVSTPLV